MEKSDQEPSYLKYMNTPDFTDQDQDNPFESSDKLYANKVKKSEHEELIEELRLIKEILQKILNHVRNRL